MKEALGLIEAVGLAAAVEAADTCLKAANVTLIGYELSKGGGYVTVKISGDVGAVNAAVVAATAAAMKVRGVYSTKVIPRPSEALGALVNSPETVGRLEAGISQPSSEAGAQTEETGTEETPASDEEAAPVEGNPETDPVPTEALEAGAADTVFQEPGDVFPEDSEVTCNICHNPACGRLKGEPRTRCITYKR